MSGGLEGGSGVDEQMGGKMPEPLYIPLRVHSEYSISSGIIHLDDLLKRCAELALPAIALTDQGNMFAAIKFYQQAISSGIKPILGCDVCLHNEISPTNPFRCTLLVQQLSGYHNLLQLISESYLSGQRNGYPEIDYEALAAHSEGLLVLSGGLESDLFALLSSQRQEQFTQYLAFWRRHFPDRYYLEISRTGTAKEEELAQKMIWLATQYDLPIVATNLACFLEVDDFEAHEARICINDGTALADPNRVKPYTPQHRLRSMQEMQELFADLPEALQNTIEIAKRCNIELTLDQLSLPIFPLPTPDETPESFLTKQANRGFMERLPPEVLNNPERRELYQARLDYELQVIIQMGFASYFLIVADFIIWAKTHGVPVGPGRGSGAGSLVAYTIYITDLDPIKYDLLFERFLNPERVSMPDFDVDFCMEGRDRVIAYVNDHYGREKVSQIITYGTMAAKAVVRDVGRVLGYPYNFVDKVAKLIPFTLGITLQQALDSEELLRKQYEEDGEVARLIDLARKLEGVVRNVGKHAGGIVIAPSALTDFVPLYCEAGGEGVVSQFDKNDVATVGLVKFDFLGLRTLTIINLAKELINQKREASGLAPIEIEKLPIDDKESYQLIASARTTGVFQLDSKMAKDVIKRYVPDCFEDIIALVAIIRPGVLQSGMLGEMIDRKHGLAPTNYLHPLLEPILRPTYGIAVYQEQVMQIAQQLAGYTLGGADLLRRTISKKKHEDMIKHRAMFLEGALARGIEEKLANEIFDQMEKFASYGFNKSHSAAYALITYQTAWLKTHYFAEFMAAILSVDMDHVDKLGSALAELKSCGTVVKLPNINVSECRFSVQDGAIIYGIGAIKGVGKAVAEYIVQERQQNGLYASFADFCARIDPSRVHRNILEGLIISGSFDEFGVNRATLLANLEDVQLAAENFRVNCESGQLDLFDFSDDCHGDSGNESEGGASNGVGARNILTVNYRRQPEFDMLDKIQRERNLLGGYISSHPLDLYQDELKNIATIDFVQLQQTATKSVRIAGLALKLRNILTRNNNNIGMLSLEGLPGNMEVTLFGDLLGQVKRLELNQILFFDGDTSWDDFSNSYRFKAKSCMTLADVRAQLARRVYLYFTENDLQASDVADFKRILQSSPGECQVVVRYQQASAWVDLALGNAYKINPQDELFNALRSRFAGVRVEVMYRG